MAVNLATKYEKQLATVQTLGSLIAGRTNTQYNWDGTQSINVLTPTTQPLGDYTRSGSNRYGTPAELQDTKQTLTLTKDKAFSITVDKGNNSDQQHAKQRGVVVRAQIEEQVVPYWDKNAFTVWGASTNTCTAVATLDKDNVMDIIIEARKKLVDQKFPVNIQDCTAYVTTDMYAFLLKNPLFMGIETLAKDMITKGVVGKSQGFLIKEVPSGYFGTGIHAIFTHRKAVIAVDKLKELHMHTNPPGINGDLIEGRYYGDAFILTAYDKGVVVSKNA